MQVPVPPAAAAPLWRLSGRDEFTRLRREGRRVRSGPLWVQWAPPASSVAPSTASTPPRCAYAIGRAVGGAVVRNRLRRRIRAVLTSLDPPLPPGDYLVGATPAAAGLSSASLRSLLAAAAAELVQRSTARPASA